MTISRWLRYAAGGLTGLVLVLVCAGVLYQWIASYRDRRASPPPGTLVDVGGFRMHIHCIGQGSPTVVLDSGLSDSWLAWFKVQPRVAQFTRVCAYDRAGLGWSDPSPRPRTSRVIAEELHALLQGAGITGPFVLVGHSMGGYDVRMYASLYRPEVAGMVLVDACHPEQVKRFPRAGSEWRRTIEWQERLMFLGVPRFMGWCGNGAPEIRSALRSFDCSVQQKRATMAEMDAFDQSAAEVAKTGSLGDMPLAVLSQDTDQKMPGVDRAFQQAWTLMQGELAQLSSRGSRVMAKGSSHQIQLEKPDLVVEAVRNVVSECRSSSRRQ